MDDQGLWERMHESMWVAFRAVPSASAGRCLELDGVLAGITPAVPERSLPNSVLYRSEDDLIAALPVLEEAYDSADVMAWTVWVPEQHDRARRALAAAGHVLDATPTAMIARLDEVEAPRPADAIPDPSPSLRDLGVINDLAYGTGDAFQRILGDGAGDPRFNYIGMHDGRAMASVVSQDHEGDTSIWWVAAAPAARGQGIVSGLMRRALADGRERGSEVSTLQATKLGRPVYERLGYRPFGTIEMWERRQGPVLGPITDRASAPP
jgi:ribosomal protein S18 acetylase RimI-like enzyme